MVTLRDGTSVGLVAASETRFAPTEGSRTSVIILPGVQGCGKVKCSMILSYRLVLDKICFLG